MSDETQFWDWVQRENIFLENARESLKAFNAGLAAAQAKGKTEAEERLIAYMLDWADWPETKVVHRVADPLELCRAVAHERQASHYADYLAARNPKEKS